MRDELSRMITQSALEDPKFIVLSGDHGYALFDEIRKTCPKQFLNVGVMEQAMIGIAAGLAKRGFGPLVYGLSAFVPIRVLEQIKLDLCFSNLPVTLLGDGAGLVYSTLGASHQCAEDIACLRPLPHIQIFSPGDVEELKACYTEALSSQSPSYIRIGKSDRPKVHPSPLQNTQPHWIKTTQNQESCIVAIGSMVGIASVLSEKLNLSVLSLPKIKPFPAEKAEHLLQNFEKVIVLEEHSRYGGVSSCLAELFAMRQKHPAILPVTLEEKFSKYCGSYQYALSEHGLADDQLQKKIETILM